MRENLLPHEDELLRAARDAASRAYAPYSRFRVGAAIETDAGRFSGCNVENASYGLCMCAERTAVFQAVAAGATHVLRCAVSCIDASDDAGIQGRMPCGACRQVLAEFCGADAEVIVDGAGVWQLNELLPISFHL